MPALLGPAIAGSALGEFAIGLAASTVGGAFAGGLGSVLQGGSFGRGAAFGALGGATFHAIGALPLPDNVWGAVGNIGLSAAAGGGISELAGGDFLTGAAFAGTIASARQLYRATLRLTGQKAADPSLKTSSGKWAPKPPGSPPVHPEGSGFHNAGTRVTSLKDQNWIEKYFIGENALPMRLASRFVPGVEGLSKAHDFYTDALKPVMPGFTSPIYNQGTIPLFYGMTVAGALYNNPSLFGAQLGIDYSD